MNEIINIMCDLDMQAKQGAMVSIPQLREACETQGVEDFQAKIWDLYMSDVCDLHTHDCVGQLSEVEKSRLYRNEYGTYFCGISIR